jgi:hypothetical protein
MEYLIFYNKEALILILNYDFYSEMFAMCNKVQYIDSIFCL